MSLRYCVEHDESGEICVRDGADCPVAQLAAAEARIADLNRAFLEMKQRAEKAEAAAARLGGEAAFADKTKREAIASAEALMVDRDAWQAPARRLATALAPFAEKPCFYYESGPGECRSFCAERDATLCDTCEARAALAAKENP